MKHYTQDNTQLNKNQITHASSKSQAKKGKKTFYPKQSLGNNFLKFMDNPDNRANKIQGVRCSSNNTFGVSHDSPDCFKLTNTVVINNSPPKKLSNQLEHVKNPQTEHIKINFRTQQKFYGLKTYFNVNDQNSQQLSTQFLPDYTNAVTKQQKPFNLVKSQYTGFIESNILSQWKDQYPLMGFQRSSEARKLNNKDRSRVIQDKLRTRQNFIRTFYQNRRLGDNVDNPHYPKQAFINTYYSKTSKKSRSTSYIGGKNKNAELFTFKNRIRSSRMELANKLNWDTHSYLVKDKVNGNNTNMSTFYNSSHTSLSRPSTSKPNLYKNKINLKQDMKKLDQILLARQAQKDHKRAHSTLQHTNITQQKNEQMMQKMEHWNQRNRMNNLTQCSNLVKKIKNPVAPKTPVI